MAHAVSCGGEFIGDGRIDVLVIRQSVTGRLWSQTVNIHRGSAQDDWKELVVGHVLHHSNYDPPSLLEQNLVVPVWIKSR